jgi:hypothetical protein
MSVDIMWTNSLDIFIGYRNGYRLEMYEYLGISHTDIFFR